MRSIRPSVQTDYVVEKITEMAVQEEKNASLNDAFTIIDLKAFQSNLNKFRLSKPRYQRPPDAERFWYTLFGVAGAHDSVVGHPPCYLTQESCNQILENYPRFKSGVDYKHLPRGFFIAKNPNEVGVRNILHYSSYLAEHSTQPVDPLAVVLYDKSRKSGVDNDGIEEANEEANEKAKEKLSPALNSWYTFLSRHCVDKDRNIICTQRELRAAFKHFVSVIQAKGLAFNDTDFSGIANEDFNPIVLLGRWETIMSNPALRPDDLEMQWLALTRLDCTKGYSILRGITDYQYSAHPCTILLPEMAVYHHSLLSSYSELNRVKNTEQAVDSDAVSFWRFLSFQPDRNSIAFYKKCLKIIAEMSDLNADSQKNIRRILLDCTTGLTHDSALSEDKQLEIWKNFCTIINNIHKASPLLLAYQGSIISIKSEFLETICQFHGMNIQFLKNCVETIIEHLGIRQILVNKIKTSDPFHSLDTLSKTICQLTTSGTDFYKGAKFYFRDGIWSGGLSLESYTDLQHELRNPALEGKTPHFLAFLPAFTPLVSTFSIKEKQHIDAVHRALADFLRDIPQDRLKNEINKLNLILRHFRMATQQLDSQALLGIIKAVSAIPTDERGEYDLPVIAFLEENFSRVFPDGYLKKKREEVKLARAGDLDAEQAQNIHNMCFLPVISERIIKTEGHLVRSYRDTNTKSLEVINDKFANCAILLPATDFDFLTDKIAEISALISAPDEKREIPTVSSLDLLLQSVVDSGGTEAFSRIYYANKIVGCTYPDIFYRFHRYISDIKKISREVKLSRIISEDLLAKFVLNATPAELADENLKPKLRRILEIFAEITAAHPHIAGNILKAFDHFNGQEDALEKITRFTNSLAEINALLPPSDSDYSAESKQNMVIFHRLIARFYSNPEGLASLTESIRAATKDSSKRKSLLRVASERIQNDESLQSFMEILAYLKHRPEDADPLYNIIETHLSRPPCISINTLAAHLREKDSFDAAALVAQYDILMAPFGERKLEYAFNREKFDTQKTFFSGVGAGMFSVATGDSMAKLTQALRQESVQELRRRFAALWNIKGEFDDNNHLELLCVCAEMLARTSSQKDPVTGKIISQEINTTQMMALHALLATGDIRKIMSQVDTGEGKSRITMVLAACMVAKGKTVDVLTSDLMLSERDYLAYSDFFASFGIGTGFISSATPSQLYQINGVNFSDNSQLILMRNRSDIDGNSDAWLDPTITNRCLIIDEADRFVHDKSRDAYNYADRSAALSGFTWIYPFLVRYVRANPSQDALDAPTAEAAQFVAWLRGNSPDNMQIATAAALLARNPAQIKTWIESARTANGMVRGVHYETTDAENLFPVIDPENNIRFSRKVLVLDSGRTVDNSTFSSGVHQCLCAIENIEGGTEDFVILPENKTLRRSFPISFLQQYEEGRVVGFSGSTRGELRSQNPDINYEGYAYINVPRHNRLIRDDHPVWGAASKAQQFEFIKRDILSRLRENRPVLLICRDDLQSSDLFRQISEDADILALAQDVPLTRVHSLTTKEAETEAVRLAGRPRQITVSTAGMFSRGVDIDSENLHVAATYIPTEEDEIQIKGRTGRMGKPGTYRMILDINDPACPVNGTTYSLEKEVRKVQRQMSSENNTEEQISKLYARFLEDMHRCFLNNYSKPSHRGQKIYMEQWADYLDNLNKNWNSIKQPLLTYIDKRDLAAFKAQFTDFMEAWSARIPLFNAEEDGSLKAPTWTDTTFKALISYRDLRAPSVAGKAQSGYDVSDDGQTRIYSSLFAQEIAFLRGERPLFANSRAAWQGRGTLFPDLKALLAGDRPLFASLRATISRLIEAITQHQKQNHRLQP